MTKQLLGSLELNRVYQMDFIDGMHLMPDFSVDLIATDPPYGKDYKSNWANTFKKIKNDDKLDWIQVFFEQLNRVSKPDSHLYCFTSSEYIGEFSLEIKKHWKLKNIIVVPRTMKGGMGDLKSSFSPQNEFIIFATKGRRKFEETQILRSSEGYLNDKRKKPKEWIYRLPDQWDWVNASVHNLKRVHATEKTVEVMETIIKLSSREGDVVFDPCVGSGTTPVAAKKNGRRFIGFETDSENIEMANLRLDSTFEENDDSKILDS